MCDQKFNHANEKQLAQLRAKNDVGQAFQLKLLKRKNKKWL